MLLEARTKGVFDASASHARGRKSKTTPLDISMFALFHAVFTDLANVNLSLLANFYHVMHVRCRGEAYGYGARGSNSDDKERTTIRCLSPTGDGRSIWSFEKGIL